MATPYSGENIQHTTNYTEPERYHIATRNNEQNAKTQISPTCSNETVIAPGIS